MPSIFASMGVPKSERDPLGRWSPSGSDDYVRTYRALINNLAHKFRAMLSCGNVLCATDEQEAIDEVKVYAARLGNLDANVLQESAYRMVTAAKLFYGIWSMDPSVTLVQGPAVPLEPSVVQEKAQEETSKHIIVLSKKGTMLRLHRAGGCWKAQTLTFASYEFCDLDPVPRNLYSHYYHTCWPRAAPQMAGAGDGEDELSDSDSATSATSESSED